MFYCANNKNIFNNLFTWLLKESSKVFCMSESNKATTFSLLESVISISLKLNGSKIG
jgi:hypothetical protein